MESTFAVVLRYPKMSDNLWEERAMSEFIFMLTRDDVTLADAREVYAEIAEDARRAEQLGVDGINLLAYRYDGDVDALVEAVVDATSLPVIAAGSVDSPERIQALAERGVWAFTIGTAALDGKLVEGAPLDEQLRAALDAAVASR